MMQVKMKRVDDQDELQQAFAVFDKDGDGHITKEELRSVMTTLGEELTDAEVNSMMAEADLDGDGRIDFEGTSLRE